jgi:serine protein kinase
MVDPRDSLLDLAARHVDPTLHAAQTWRGSFAEYLALVERDPRVARNAWQRLLDMIESHGSIAAARAGQAPRWSLFDDPFHGGREAVYGLDEPLDRFVRTVRAGAHGFGPERRILLLHGPVGAAKSTIARLLKRGLECYSRTDAGALYTFEWLVDGEIVASPTHQEPLLLLPREARAAIEQRFQAARRTPYAIRIEGELDPVSRYWFRELMNRHGGDWRKVVEHVRVKRLFLSEDDRIGIGTFQPKDEKNQDATELTGDVNYRRIADYGSDADPRAFNFDGEFNVANRGLVEFIEVLKLDVAFLYDLLGATQEHAVKPRKFAQTHIDEVILGHTNEPEYKKLASNELMEAFRDRTIKIDVPYNLSHVEEARIYHRQFDCGRSAGKFVAPHALEVAALWAVLTRLTDPTHPTLSVLQKAKLYAGEPIQGFTAEQVREMRDACESEGLAGISPRYVQDRIAAALVAGKPWVGPFDVLDSLHEGLRHHSLVSNEETRKRYNQLLALAREDLEERLKHEVQSAVASDRESSDRLCAKYVDNVKAYTTREKVIDATGKQHDPDERLMRAIEQKIDIPEARKDDFRHELMNYIAALAAEGKTFDYRANQRLRRALELKLFEDRRDTIQLTSLVSSVVDPETRAKIDAIRDRLIAQFGYHPESAEDVLQRVADLFARGETKQGASEAA